MKIQASTDYAIRIMLYLHQHKGELHTAMTIAEAIGITYPNFIRIADKLRKGGLVRTIQGRSGGQVLGKDAHEVRVYDVFFAIEGDLQINRCLEDDQFCSRGNPENCEVHTFLSTLQGKMIEEMSEQTIADFADECA